MKNKEIGLKGGVLIIGSLLWQDYLNDRDDFARKSWRDKHLILDEKIMVKVPIRYGRYSRKDNIYTMTISNSINKKKMGTGYFVPFSNQNINNFNDLMYESEALSKAEGMGGLFFNSWGSIGLLFNSNKENNSQNNLSNLWSNKFINNTFDNKVYKVNKEKPSIKKNGLLNIYWISCVDKRESDNLNNYDFLITAVTMPTQFPTPLELAENVKKDTKRYYFTENYKNGITTFQDISILNQL